MLPPEQRDLLNRELDAVLGEDTWQAFATNPILDPDGISFPEGLAGEEERLGFLLLYLLDHAGLDELEVQLEAWTLDPDGYIPDGQPFEPYNDAMRLAYAGTESGSCRVVYDPMKLDDRTRLFGAAALLVGEVHRDLCGEADDELQEGNTLEDELHAFCMGFGVLLANASFHVDAWHEHQVSVTRTTTQGLLGPERLGYLLALQVASRDEDADTIARVRSALSANPAGSFSDSLRVLAEDDLAALGLPPRLEWPAAPVAGHRDDELQRLRVARDSATHLREVEEARLQRNRARPVFRVPTNHHQFRAILKGAGLGIVVLAVVASMGLPKVGVAALLVTTALGFVAGRQIEAFECSDQDCRAEIDHSMTHCPGCGGIVAGELESADERLEAEEAWRERKRQDSEHEPGHW